MLKNNSLNLLSTYESDYSDDDIQEIHTVKKQCRLPVPNIFLQDSNDTENNNSTLHDGRIRSFPHERGNWASYIYIPCNIENISELTESLLEIVPKSLGLQKTDDFHISLTKTFVLKYHWIDSFVESVKKILIPINSFYILFDNFKIYCNEERTRTFIGICVKNETNLVNIVKTLDKCLDEFNLPPFYKDPSFHISIGWCAGDVQNELTTFLQTINTNLFNYEDLVINVKYLQCKIGHKVYNFTINTF